jgi:RNA polymerase sigma-70 factor (ECF subfamily)
VFDEDYAAVAETLDRSEAAVRQLASRAREHVREARPRFSVSQDRVLELVQAFMAAAAGNDLGRLAGLLAEDAVMVTDGGGKRKAALRVLVGRADIVNLLERLAWRGGGLSTVESIEPARINGWPGLVLRMADGPETLAFEPDASGLIGAIYAIRNPEKLGHVAARRPASDVPSSAAGRPAARSP